MDTTEQAPPQVQRRQSESLSQGVITVAIVGRPNVGKSTLFNRLTRSNAAIVSDFPGLTRDRQYGTSKHNGQSFIWIDTGGITEEEDAGINTLIAEQSLLAIEESDYVLFVVDARDGLVPGDEQIARHLRREGKKVLLVINKVDGKTSGLMLHEFFSLGIESQAHTAAVHGRGIEKLLDQICENSLLEKQIQNKVLAEVDQAQSELCSKSELDSNNCDERIKIAIVGRPNVGKSTLMNRILKEERSVVFDMPGTTVDSIYVPFERHGQSYTLIDTAGVRRRGKIERGVERFSVVKTLKAISDAHVVILVMDAREGLVDQDLHLLGFILEAGRAGVVVCNKWDGLTHDQKNNVHSELDRRLEFANYLKVHKISALHGTGVGNVFDSIGRAYKAANTHVKTPRLTAMLEHALSMHPPPLVRGRRIKLRYAHMGGLCPPLIVVHGNQTTEVPNAYRRYLQNYFRKALKIEGTPIHFEFKTGQNPYAGRVNKLSARQVQKRRRLMKFVKK